MVDGGFASAMRSSGDLAGVFEYDGRVGYFYLVRVSGDDDYEIIDHLRLFQGITIFKRAAPVIRWVNAQCRVELLNDGQVVAFFDVITGEKWREEEAGS